MMDGQTEQTKEIDALDMIGIEAQQGESKAQAGIDAIINPEPEIDPATTWAQIPMVVGGMLAMIMPELRQHYTEKACLAWGQGMQQVADKYGWDAGEVISKWAPECALVIASVPLILPTVAAIRVRRAAHDEKKQPEKKEGVTDLNQNPMHDAPGGFSEPV